MAFGLDFSIRSMFESDGFDKAEKAMAQMDKKGESLGLSVEELQSRMDALNMSSSETHANFWKAEEGSAGFKNGLEELGSEQAAVAAAAEEMGESQEFVRDQLKRTNVVLHENTEGAKQFRDMTTSSFIDSKDASAEMRDQLQRFEFDMLSIMFAGMALSRTLEGLTKPAMESAGVFDVISQTLELFFLPAALSVLRLVLFLQDALLIIPKSVQKVIGIMAVLGIILGKVASFLGITIMNWSQLSSVMLTLKKVGIGVAASLKASFLGIAASAKGAAAGIYAALGPVGLILGAIVLAVGAFALAWKKNFLGIKQRVGKFIKWIGNNLPTIVRFFMPILGVIDLVIKAINRLFGRDIDTLGSKFEDIGDNIADMGDEMIASGEEMDELDKKADKNPFEDAVPDNGPNSETVAGGTGNGQTQVVNQKTENNVNVESAPDMNERQQARETEKVFGRLKNNKYRGK